MSNDAEWQVPADRRARRIQEVTESVIRVMLLRPPQAEALRLVARMLQRLPGPLCEATPEQVKQFMTDGDKWHHTAHPTFTLALATGVGKTRLAGAIMALLFLSKEARTFLILAPRRAVLRRFSDALDPQFREYVFVERRLVPDPYVIMGDQISEPAGVEAQPDLFRHGPTVYLLSPQLIATSGRFQGNQAFTGVSPAEYLLKKKDLVVIADEAHHFGGRGQRDAARWTEAIRALRPKAQFDLTATPRGEEGENILYEYTLARALIERHYTKDVHLLVRNFEGSPLSDKDIDQATISYALERLSVKTASMALSNKAPFPAVKPVAVLFARDINHAEWVATVLRDVHGLDDAEVLVTHSKSSKKEEEVERLLSIEDIANPVRVVVNVQELTEGWDVRNVYVVAPLRAMATFQGALQAMGRGLRLPAGERVEQPELDSLDVVCFGKQSLKTIVEQATTWLGRGGNSGGLIVDPHDTSSLVALPLLLAARRDVTLQFDELEPAHEEVAIKVEPAAIQDIARMAVEDLDLVRLKSSFSGEKVVRLPRDRFLRATVMRTLQVAGRYLSDDQHYAAVEAEVLRWLAIAGRDGESVEFDPAEVGEQIGQIIVAAAQRRALPYHPTGRRESISFPAFSVMITRSCEPGMSPTPPTLHDVGMTTQATFVPDGVYRGLDGHEWTSSVHPAYAFSSFPEVRMAWLLDHDAAVEWWIRNEPRKLRIQTPPGLFSPDFVVKLADGTLLLLEVKGAMYWAPPDSDARIKAAAATRWVEARNALGDGQWQFGVALDSDLLAAGSFGSLSALLRG